MRRDLTIHLFQWEVVPGDVEKNLGKVEELLQGSGLERGDLVVLPEMFPSGFSYDVLDGVSGKSDEVIKWLADRARQSGVGISGSLAMRVGGGVCNTMVFIDCEGKTAASYDKIHLFPGTGEDLYFAPGDRVVVVESGNVKFGLAICFDLRFPEIVRRLCLQGAQIVLVCAQWPVTRIEHFKDLVRVRAMENQLFVAACNSCGKDASGIFIGGKSMVAGPTGAVAGTLGTEEDVLSIRVSPTEVSKVRKDFPVLECRRGDIFGEG